MEQKEKEQKTNGEKNSQCGCFDPSSRIGRMMLTEGGSSNIYVYGSEIFNILC